MWNDCLYTLLDGSLSLYLGHYTGSQALHQLLQYDGLDKSHNESVEFSRYY